MDASCSSIEALFLKPESGLAMIRREEIVLKVGRGIEDDINANPMSPRQVLVVRSEDSQALSISAGELRENMVIRGIDPGLLIPGAAIAINDTPVIRLTFYCEPCKRIAPLVPSWKSIKGKRGVLGVVLADAVLRSGDRVTIKPNAFPPFSRGDKVAKKLAL